MRTKAPPRLVAPPRGRREPGAPTRLRSSAGPVREPLPLSYSGTTPPWLDQSAHPPGKPALVAQGIEQRFPKPRVGGSSPSGGTTTGACRVAKLLLNAVLGAKTGREVNPTLVPGQLARSEASPTELWAKFGLKYPSWVRKHGRPACEVTHSLACRQLWTLRLLARRAGMPRQGRHPLRRAEVRALPDTVARLEWVIADMSAFLEKAEPSVARPW